MTPYARTERGNCPEPAPPPTPRAARTETRVTSRHAAVWLVLLLCLVVVAGLSVSTVALCGRSRTPHARGISRAGRANAVARGQNYDARQLAASGKTDRAFARYRHANEFGREYRSGRPALGLPADCRHCLDCGWSFLRTTTRMEPCRPPLRRRHTDPGLLGEESPRCRDQVFLDIMQQCTPHGHLEAQGHDDAVLDFRRPVSADG